MLPNDIRISDIAHSLSNQCRFNGYTSRHYSVAEHSVLLAGIVERRATQSGMSADAIKRVAFQGLMHDATEAYLCDIPRPLKAHLGNYKDIEARLWEVICNKYGVDEELHPFVFDADMRMCVTEKVTLISPEGLDRPEWAGLNANYKAYEGDENPVQRNGHQPEAWRARFLAEFERLRPHEQ